eukprot:5257674-Alexandrium_andersonii.AAC.1
MRFCLVQQSKVIIWFSRHYLTVIVSGVRSPVPSQSLCFTALQAWVAGPPLPHMNKGTEACEIFATQRHVSVCARVRCGDVDGSSCSPA